MTRRDETIKVTKEFGTEYMPADMNEWYQAQDLESQLLVMAIITEMAGETEHARAALQELTALVS